MQIVMLGDPLVGKTRLLQTYCKKEEIDLFTIIKTELGDVSFIDLSGDDNYDRLRAIHYPYTNAFILIFSQINPVSFVNLSAKWVNLLIENKLSSAPLLIVGVDADKRDPKNDKHVNEEQIQSMLKRVKQKISNVKYCECSFQDLAQMQKVFESAIEMAAKYSPPTPEEKSSLGNSRYNFHNENTSETNSDQKLLQIQNKIAQKMLKNEDNKKNFTF